MIDAVYYTNDRGQQPFCEWLEKRDKPIREKIGARITRALLGLGVIEPVGEGVFEIKTDDGFRIYFGRTGDVMVLLHGGTKKRQSADIDVAKRRWRHHVSKSKK